MAAGGSLRCSVARHTSSVVVTVTGELDCETAPRLLLMLDGNLAVAPGDEVRLDMTRLTFLDVSGARALIEAAADVALAGGRLTVLGLNGTARQVAEVTGLSQYLYPPD